MSRRQEIIRRANEEFSGVLQRGAALRGELERQRKDALAAVPVAKAALRKHDAARTAAFTDYTRALKAAAADAAATEDDAGVIQADGEAAATDKWRDSVAAAEERRAEALVDARRDYAEAYRLAAELTGPERDKKVAAARAARESAERSAERAYRRDTDAAWASYQRASSAARDKAVAAVERARLKQAQAEARAAEALVRAQEAARQALDAALADDPAAAAIVAGFESRLEQVEAQLERDKADVLARMKRDLANARG
ncbi:MAG: hypothetical protein AB7O67_18970 [Vicinamibacterales bacterium]